MYKTNLKNSGTTRCPSSISLTPVPCSPVAVPFVSESSSGFSAHVCYILNTCPTRDSHCRVPGPYFVRLLRNEIPLVFMVGTPFSSTRPYLGCLTQWDIPFHSIFVFDDPSPSYPDVSEVDGHSFFVVRKTCLHFYGSFIKNVVSRRDF